VCFSVDLCSVSDCTVDVLIELDEWGSLELKGRNIFYLDMNFFLILKR